MQTVRRSLAKLANALFACYTILCCKVDCFTGTSIAGLEVSPQQKAMAEIYIKDRVVILLQGDI